MLLLPHTQQLERRDIVASQTLRAALTKAEQAHPGLSYDIVMSILKKGDLNVNLNESILRLQGNAAETDREYDQTAIANLPYMDVLSMGRPEMVR